MAARQHQPVTASEYARLLCDPEISNLGGFGPKHTSLYPSRHELAYLWPRAPLTLLPADRRLTALAGQKSHRRHCYHPPFVDSADTLFVITLERNLRLLLCRNFTEKDEKPQKRQLTPPIQQCKQNINGIQKTAYNQRLLSVTIPRTKLIRSLQSTDCQNTSLRQVKEKGAPPTAMNEAAFRPHQRAALVTEGSISGAARAAPTVLLGAALAAMAMLVSVRPLPVDCLKFPHKI